MCREQLANVTVSVPEDLKRKMKDTEGVNWSEIAQHAFEDAVRQKKMREAAERIRKIREGSRSPGWSGVREIRRWRDAGRRQ